MLTLCITSEHTILTFVCVNIMCFDVAFYCCCCLFVVFAFLLFVCLLFCVCCFVQFNRRTQLLVLAVISFGQFWSKVTAVLPQYFFTGPLSFTALILPDILIFIRYVDTVSDLIFVPNVSAWHWSEDTKPQIITSDLTTGTWSTGRNGENALGSGWFQQCCMYHTYSLL